MQEAKNQTANGQTPMDSERAAVVASAAQAAGITSGGMETAFASGVDLADENPGANRNRGNRGGGGSHGRGGRGRNNNAGNASGAMVGGDMGGYGIGPGGRNYGEIGGYHDGNSMMHTANSVASFTAGMPRAPSVGQIGGNMKKTDSMAFLESFLQEEVKMAEAKQQNGVIPTHPSALGSHHGMHAPPPMRDTNYHPSYNHGSMNAPAGMSIDGDDEGTGGGGGGEDAVSAEGGGSNGAALSRKRPLSEMSGSSSDAKSGEGERANGGADGRGDAGSGRDYSRQQQPSEREQQGAGSKSQQRAHNGAVAHQQHAPPPYGDYGRYYGGEDPHGYPRQHPHDQYPYPPHPMHDPRGGYGPPSMHGYPGAGYGPGGVPHYPQGAPHYPQGGGGGYYFPQDRGGGMGMPGAPHTRLHDAGSGGNPPPGAQHHPMHGGGGGGGMQGGYYNPLAGHPPNIDDRAGYNQYAYNGRPAGRAGPDSDRPPGGPPPPEKPFTPGMRRATSMELLKRVSSHELVSMGKQQPGGAEGQNGAGGGDGDDEETAEEARATAVPVSKDEKCAFCAEANVDTQLRPCGHFFHGRCLKPWLQATDGPACCLQCQTPISSCVLAIITPGVPTRNATRGTEEMVPPPPPPLPPKKKDADDSGAQGVKKEESSAGSGSGQGDEGSEKDVSAVDGESPGDESTKTPDESLAGSAAAKADDAASGGVSSDAAERDDAAVREGNDDAIDQHEALVDAGKVNNNELEEEDDEDRMVSVRIYRKCTIPISKAVYNFLLLLFFFWYRMHQRSMANRQERRPTIRKKLIF